MFEIQAVEKKKEKDTEGSGRVQLIKICVECLVRQKDMKDRNGNRT